MFYIMFLMFLVSSILAVTTKLQGLPVNLTTIETSSRDKLEIYKTFCNQTESERIYKNIKNFTKNIKPIHHQRLNIRGDKKVIEITENIWEVTTGDETTVSNVANGTIMEYSTNIGLDQITEITTKYTLISTEHYENSSSDLLNTTTAISDEDLPIHSVVFETSESTTQEMGRHTVQEITTEAQLLTESEDNILSSLSLLHSTQQAEPSSNKTINITIVETDESTTEQINKMSTTIFSNDKLITQEKDIVTEDYTRSSINNSEIKFSKFESDLEKTTLKAVSMLTYENISNHSTSGYLTTTYKENGFSTDETLLPDNITMTVETVSNAVTLNKMTIPETSATKIESSSELTTAENLIIFNTNETIPKMTTLEAIEVVIREETALTSNLPETELRQTTEIDISELATEQTKSSEQSDLHMEDTTQYSFVNQTNDSDLNTTFLSHVSSASTGVIVTELVENTQHSQGTVLTTVTNQPITAIKKELLLNPTETIETDDSELIRPVYHPFNNFTIEIPQKRQEAQSVHQPLHTFFLTFPSKKFVYSVRNPTGRTLATRP